MPPSSQRTSALRAAGSPGSQKGSASSRRAVLQAQRVERRQPALAHGARQRRQLGRGAVDRAPLEVQPAAVKRAEDRERLAGLRARLGDVDDVRAAVRLGADAGVRERDRDAPVARAGVGRDVARPEHGLRVGLAGEGDELVLGHAVADDESAAESRSAVSSARRQPSMNCVRGADAKRPCRSASSRTNTRDDAVELARGERQRRVVGDPQVAAKPEQGGRWHEIEVRG